MRRLHAPSGPSITLTRLYERVSKKGVTYLAGKLGYTSVAIFKTDSVTDEGQCIWRMVWLYDDMKDDHPEYQSWLK